MSDVTVHVRNAGGVSVTLVFRRPFTLAQMESAYRVFVQAEEIDRDK